MMQSIEHGKRDNLSFSFFFFLRFSALRNFLVDPPVWSDLAKILDVFFARLCPFENSETIGFQAFSKNVDTCWMSS